MSREIKIHDEDWALGSSFSSIRKHRNGTGKVSYVTGLCISKDGVVRIMQQGYREDDKYLSLSYFVGNRVYYRTIRGKIYTELGIARKAFEFAREINDANANLIATAPEMLEVILKMKKDIDTNELWDYVDMIGIQSAIEKATGLTDKKEEE